MIENNGNTSILHQMKSITQIEQQRQQIGRKAEFPTRFLTLQE